MPIDDEKGNGGSNYDRLAAKPPQNAVSSSSALANSPAFVCPSLTPTSARFGSALNIETLVAAAERKETPIDETVKGLGPGCIFTFTAIAKWECSSYGRALALHARGTGFDSQHFFIFSLCLNITKRHTNIKFSWALDEQ
nr:CCR4-Not transcription complex subunit 1-like [Tanacetum cinerariifolium]